VAAIVAAVRAVGAAVLAALEEANVAVAFGLLATVVHLAPTATRPRAALRVADAAAGAMAAAAVREAAVGINSLTVAAAAASTGQNRSDKQRKARQRHHHDLQALQTSTHHDFLLNSHAASLH
jgi:hypothetical protein